MAAAATGLARADAPRIGPAQCAERLAELGFTVQRTGSGWRGQCPLHDDNEPSLMISEGRAKQQLLLHCFGCGAKFSDVFARSGSNLQNRPSQSLYNCVKGVNDYII